MAWRGEDEALLTRLEDEALADTLLRALVDAPPTTKLEQTLHPRAGGFVEALRDLPGGANAIRQARDGDARALASFVHALELGACPPKLLHHLALIHRKAATLLENESPDRAAGAWVRSLAAWLALLNERSYVDHLAVGIVGDEKTARSSVDRLPLDVIGEIAARADQAAGTLAPAGRAALLALARVEEASALAHVPEATARRVRSEALRRRNGAIEMALHSVRDAFDEAAMRGDLPNVAGALLEKVLPVWTWTSNDEAVEHFVVERVSTVGWDLHRANRWDALRDLLRPLYPMFDSLGRRIEGDRSHVAYAASCAQMFVFLAETARVYDERLRFAERSVRVCPTHRNGRLVLAAALCEDALAELRGIVVFAQKSHVDRIQAKIERAETLYPDTRDLPEAKALLEQVKRSRIAV